MIKGMGKVGIGVLTGLLVSVPLVSGTYTSQKGTIDSSRKAIEGSIETIRGKITEIKGIHSQDKQALIGELEKIHSELEASKGSNGKLETENTRLETELRKANSEIEKANSEQNTINRELEGTKNKINSFIEGIEIPQPIELPKDPSPDEGTQEETIKEIKLSQIQSDEEIFKYLGYYNEKNRSYLSELLEDNYTMEGLQHLISVAGDLTLIKR